MVEPSWCIRTTRRLIAAVVGIGSLGLAGCSVVPQSRLDDCHRLSQTLQVENNRLKDATISLRSQNQDLNQRAVDDALRLRLQDEEIQRLVQSVSAYQEEREQLAAAFERIKGQIRTAVGPNPVSSALLGRLGDLARAHPGWEFDAERGILSIPTAPLFETGSDQLRGDARAWLHEVAAAWKVPEASDVDLLVVGRNETSAVRRAALSPQEASGQARTLGLERAARVRALLVGAAGVDAARVEVAGFEVPHAAADGPDGASPARNRRIEIHLRPVGPGPPAAAGRSNP